MKAKLGSLVGAGIGALLLAPALANALGWASLLIVGALVVATALGLYRLCQK